MADSPDTLAQRAERNPSSSPEILQAAKGGSILFVGRLFEYASRFVLGIILARSLGADGLGLFSLGLTVALMLGAIARLGLIAGMEHFLPPAIYRRDAARVWGTLQMGLVLSASAGIVVAVVLFAMADFIAVNLLDEPEVATFLRLISITVPMMSMGRVLLASVRSFKRMQYHVYAESLVFSISRFGLTVSFLVLGFGVAGAMAAYALAWMLEIAVLFAFLNHLFPLRRPLNSAQRNLRELLTFSAPLFLNSLIGRLGGSAGFFMLGLLGTLTSVGVYTAAARVQTIGGVLLTATSHSARPIISDLYYRGDHTQLALIYQTVTRWSLSFLLPYFLTAVLFATPLLAIFGEDFEAGTPVLIILSFGSLIGAATGITSAMIVMTGHSRVSFGNTVVWVVLSVGLGVLLIPRWGLIGAAVASVLAGGILSVVRLFQVRWILTLWPYNRMFIKPIVAGAVALCVGLAANRILPADSNLYYLILDITLLWLAYAAVTMLLGLTPEDRWVLSRTKRRFSTMLAWR